MAKPKAQTMQQKMGFMDSDLGTQKHDEIMLWLDANIEAVIESITGNKAEVENKIWEYPIVQRGGYGNTSKFVIGFIDLVAISSIENRFKGQIRNACFEVKSSIPSLGELIRQIKMYETYIHHEHFFVVVSPDARFADALRSQGIEFYHYAPDGADAAMMRQDERP